MAGPLTAASPAETGSGAENAAPAVAGNAAKAKTASEATIVLRANKLMKLSSTVWGRDLRFWMDEGSSSGIQLNLRAMPFADILTANSSYAQDHEELADGRARRGLAIVTCIDTRIDPLEAFGLIPGDAKVIRNAGARVTDDVLRTLIIASHALGVNRIALIQHTDCGVANNTQESLASIVETQTGESIGGLDFLTIDDQVSTLHADAKKLRDCKLLPEGTEVGEFIFDVHSGKLTPAE